MWQVASPDLSRPFFNVFIKRQSLTLTCEHNVAENIVCMCATIQTAPRGLHKYHHCFGIRRHPIWNKCLYNKNPSYKGLFYIVCAITHNFIELFITFDWEQKVLISNILTVACTPPRDLPTPHFLFATITLFSSIPDDYEISQYFWGLLIRYVKHTFRLNEKEGR